jgi:hypothetical protein
MGRGGNAQGVETRRRLMYHSSLKDQKGKIPSFYMKDQCRCSGRGGRTGRLCVRAALFGVNKYTLLNKDASKMVRGARDVKGFTEFFAKFFWFRVR